MHVGAVLDTFLHTEVLRRSAGEAASLRSQRELQGVSALGSPASLRSIAVQDHQSAVLFGGSRAGRAAVRLGKARRVAALVAGGVVVDVGEIARGDAAALDVGRVAVGVAVLLVDVLSQFPPLPLFQHLRLHLRR